MCGFYQNSTIFLIRLYDFLMEKAINYCLICIFDIFGVNSDFIYLFRQLFSAFPVLHNTFECYSLSATGFHLYILHLYSAKVPNTQPARSSTMLKRSCRSSGTVGISVILKYSSYTCRIHSLYVSRISEIVFV